MYININIVCPLFRADNTGATWCYVDSRSPCLDKQRSVRLVSRTQQDNLCCCFLAAFAALPPLYLPLLTCRLGDHDHDHDHDHDCDHDHDHDHDHEESSKLWCQSSFALLQCFVEHIISTRRAERRVRAMFKQNVKRWQWWWKVSQCEEQVKMEKGVFCQRLQLPGFVYPVQLHFIQCPFPNRF